MSERELSSIFRWLEAGQRLRPASAALRDVLLRPVGGQLHRERHPRSAALELVDCNMCGEPILKARRPAFGAHTNASADGGSTRVTLRWRHTPPARAYMEMGSSAGVSSGLKNHRRCAGEVHALNTWSREAAKSLTIRILLRGDQRFVGVRERAIHTSCS